MNKEDIYAELNSPEYKAELEKMVSMRVSMIECLLYCYMDTARDSESARKNFILRVFDDLIQSITSVEHLARQGFMNNCKRELRYLLELALMANFIVISAPSEEFECQIKKYDKTLNSPNINLIAAMPISYLDEAQQAEFKDSVRRLYGFLCKYVHASTHQIEERLMQAVAGRTMGYVGTDAFRELNALLEKVYSSVIVFLFNSVPQHVVGDYLVLEDGGIHNWYFNQSRFVGMIDAWFDYKHERQRKLKELSEKRTLMVRF